MNLTKLFNFSYLKENIKKSKGILFLSLILVPVFTALVTIFLVNDGNSFVTKIPEQIEISWVNIIGMYGVPLVLSFSLFGYVYKKNSVDFINSMPINRKTIFITNTIGGIVLITIMQIITALILLICNAAIPNILIFPEMIWDIFVLMWISYVFMFTATNLAMTFSGTFFTQIAATLLILFLVPFCVDSLNEFSRGANYEFIKGENSFKSYTYEDTNSYTMPYKILTAVIGSTEEIYSTKSNIKMLILGIAYFLVGLYLFQKRKMENTEESFASIKMHIFVKALTMVPMMLILNLIDPDVDAAIIILTLIIVYYFVYDFIVKRKVSLKVSIPSLILILGILQLGCMGGEYAKEKLLLGTLNRENIKGISIESSNYWSRMGNYSYKTVFRDTEYFVENEEIIDLIFDSACYVEDMYNRNDEEETSSSVDVYDVKVTQSDITVENKYLSTVLMNVIMKDKKGKEYEVAVNILEEDADKIFEFLEKDDNYVNAIKEEINHDGALKIENILCDEETKQIIKKEIKDKLETMSLADIYRLFSIEECSISNYYYEDHELKNYEITNEITENIKKISTNKLNEHTVSLLKETLRNDEYTGNFLVRLSEDSSGQKYTPTANGVTVSHVYFYRKNDEIIDFILKNGDEEFDPTKEYYVLENHIGSYTNYVYFFTNKIDEIDKLIEEESFASDYDF